MRKLLKAGIGILMPVILVFSGCAANKEPSNASDNPVVQIKEKEEQAGTIPYDFNVDPESFELSFLVNGETVPVSSGIKKREFKDYEENEGSVSFRYPAEQIKVTLRQEKAYLSVEITSEKEGDNTFSWPEISADQYYMPFGEGKRIPSDSPEWKEYLNNQQFAVIEQLSMPFWISQSKDHCILFIMENPDQTQMSFLAEDDITFSVSREYPEIDENKTGRYRIYITDNNPVSAAKLYRSYVKEKGSFVTLEEKAVQNPNIKKLYGAPFIYLWGDFIVSDQDINWNAFRQSLNSPILEHLLSFSDVIENGEEFKSALNEIKQQDYVAQYQKNVICSYISLVLKNNDFWEPSLFLKSSGELASLLQPGYENLSESKRIQVNKYALAANMPEVFHDADSWMDSSTVNLLNEMKESGIDNAWIGLNGWEQAYAKPELVELAQKLGYLIASYDSYHSIHEPGKAQWITAQFDDDKLYDDATVTDRDGQKISGFKNVGRKLNPVLSLPSVKKRMEEIMSNSLPFNSWFIDCDATGEIYNDYTPGHITTQNEDMKARLERMSYIRDQYNLVVGSEGGNDFAASTIAFAHGIELKSFSWIDEDMKSNKDSEYYIGKYYNPNGGVAEHFSKRIPVKEQYLKIFEDPEYDIPLFKLVYNDSVITSYHWDWSTFKIKGATSERMVREVLYNIPPMYHLDAEEWDKYKQDIINHQTVWSDFNRQAVTKEMTDFAYLTEDGSVQRTAYGEDLTAIANFGDSAFEFEGEEIMPNSVLINENGSKTIYTPTVQKENQ